MPLTNHGLTSPEITDANVHLDGVDHHADAVLIIQVWLDAIVVVLPKDAVAFFVRSKRLDLHLDKLAVAD